MKKQKNEKREKRKGLNQSYQETSERPPMAEGHSMARQIHAWSQKHTQTKRKVIKAKQERRLRVGAI